MDQKTTDLKEFIAKVNKKDKTNGKRLDSILPSGRDKFTGHK